MKLLTLILVILILCPQCQGIGSWYEHSKDSKVERICPICNGTGEVEGE